MLTAKDAALIIPDWIRRKDRPRHTWGACGVRRRHDRESQAILKIHQRGENIATMSTGDGGETLMAAFRSRQKIFMFNDGDDNEQSSALGQRHSIPGGRP